MNEYDLTITRRELNPHYDEQVKEYRERTRHSFTNDVQPPEQYLKRDMLTVVIDEATFAVIRKAAVESM